MGRTSNWLNSTSVPSMLQESVFLLGKIQFDQNMTMEAHVSSVARSAAFHTRNISRIRKTSILRLVAGMLFLGVARGYSSLLKSYI